METIVNETLQDLLISIGNPPLKSESRLNIISNSNTRYLRDVKINIGNVLKVETLNEKERLLLALAVAVNDDNETLESGILNRLKEVEIKEEEIAETYACVSLLQVNNVFYRFRHFTQKEFYEKTPAGIKMSIMLNPVLGKEFFELMSLAISALNGCEQCVVSHEASVLNHGGSEQRIYDAIRLTAVFKGLVRLL
ncbi:MAG: carboxymuconolactone decarboxylase family protein [Flavobacteriales bacterium]|nr:carboxymuconolactone decarboxylase family protein [Flavobacteriales bacterium]